MIEKPLYKVEEFGERTKKNDPTYHHITGYEKSRKAKEILSDLKGMGISPTEREIRVINKHHMKEHERPYWEGKKK